MSFKVGAPARVGLVAPNSVEVPAGGTGLDPSQTNFFQVCSSASGRPAKICFMHRPLQLCSKFYVCTVGLRCR